MAAQDGGFWPVKTIVVGVDGSDESDAALKWAAKLASALGAEVVAVHAIPPPAYASYPYEFSIPVEYDAEWREMVKSTFEDRWCEPLRQAGVKFKTVLEDGRPAGVICDVADRSGAELVVAGRRGRGGVAELLLGSVSRELSHHSHRPVVLISKPRA